MAHDSQALVWTTSSGKVVLNVRRVLALIDKAGDIKTEDQKRAYSMFQAWFEDGNEPELKNASVFGERHIRQHRQSITNAVLIAALGQQLSEVSIPFSFL
jgi:hypothetical protein